MCPVCPSASTGDVEKEKGTESLGGCSRPAEEAAGWARGAGSVRTPARHPALFPREKTGKDAERWGVGREEHPETETG